MRTKKHIFFSTTTINWFSGNSDKLKEFREKLDEEQRRKRAAFLEGEKKRQGAVDLEKLTTVERRIHDLHKEAVEDFKFTYNDPISNYKVVTTYRHFLKGSCCGNACRHCIYNHEAVFEARKKERTFNTSFWRDIEDERYTVMQQNRLSCHFPNFWFHSKVCRNSEEVCKYIDIDWRGSPL